MVKTLETFGVTVRNEVDLNQLSERLLAVVQNTTQPTHISLWLRTSEQSKYIHTKILALCEPDKLGICANQNAIP